MIYLKNNTEKQRIFIPKNGEYQGKKSYREGYEEGVEVGKAEQKSFLEPIVINENGIYENENGYSVVEVNVEGEVCPELEDVVISANGEYEGAFGKVIVDVPQEELEEINITENGIYEGAYDRVIVDVPQEGGDINPDTLREITITENGVYTSKYSTPIEKEVTGIFDDGSPFYGYGELNGIIYDTQINLNDIGVLESLEFWYKGDGQDVGDGWNIILASNSEDSANEGCVEFRYASGNENYVRIGGDERSFQLEEGVWHHFKLNKTGDDICTLFVDDVEKESFPLPTATSTNFYINSSYYDANGDGWEGNRNANGCFGMIKIDDQTFVPTENGFINYNTQESLPVVKAGDYSYNTTDIKLEGEPYKTINVDVQPNLASLDVTLTQNGSYNLGVEDGVDGYNRGTIVVDVPTKVGSITITENGTYYPQDETIKFLMFDGDDVFDLGQGFFIEDVANMVLLTINFKWVGDETGEPMNICGVENSDWDSESCFAIRYYDGNFSAKVGSFEMNLPADNEWHHMEIAYRSGVGYIVFDGSLYQEELGNFNKPTGNIYVGATNTGGEIFRPFRGYISDVVISGNIDRISYTPIDNGFRGSNGEEITDNIGGGYCDLDEEPIPNTAPIGYNEIHVNVPQEGGGCNLEPLWVTPYWENRDESNYVHYNPSEGMNGFDSAHIDLYPVHEDGKQEAINGLGHLVATEQKTYTAQKETKTRKYVHLDGDDYFEINTFLSHTNKIEFELMRYDLERRMILGNPTCYFAFDLEGLVANYRGKYTNPIPVENVKWVKVTMTTDYGLEVISEYGKRSEPWQGDFIYPNIEDNFTIGEGFGDYERNFGGNISTIEIHDNENNIQVVEPWQDGFYQGVFIMGETIYENQGGGTATYGEESYDIGVDGWKSVEVNVDAGSIVAETARVLDITENGTYKSQYSEPTYPDAITGVYPNGENFYSYAQLTNKVFNTGIKLNEISKIEVWYKPKGTTLTHNGGIVGTNNTAFNIITTTGAFSGKIGNTTRNYRLPFNNREKWYHIELSYDEGFVVDGVNYGKYTQTQLNQETLIWINKYNYSADGYFGMIKIDDTIIIPTADGFRNTNTGRLLEVVTAGDYVFTEELPIYSEGNLIKTINVNVQPNLIPFDKTITKNGTYIFAKKEGMDGYSSGQVVVDVQPNNIDIAEAGIKFGHSTFSSVPEWADFSNVTDMSNMFYECDNITTIPLIDTSNAITMLSMFAYCDNITTIPSINTSNVTEMRNMFYDCRKLTSIPLIDTSNVTDMRNMFCDCLSLTSIPQLDTSKVTDMWWMFHNCSNLTTIPQLDFSNVNNASGMFIYCTKLTNLGGFINLHDNLDISYSNKITRESILNIFNDMAVVTNRSIKLHEVVYSQLTEEDIAIATQKGWSVEIG